MSMPAERISPELNLRTLLDGIAEAPALPITGLTSDSRQVRPGDVFLALSGIDSHGLDYIDQARMLGAVAVLHDTGMVAPSAEVATVAIPNLARHVGTIADRWFRAPSADMQLAGVTGTNGKTTVAFLLAECLRIAGRESAYIGTLGAGMRELAPTSGMTTPACVDLHHQLADLRDTGADCVALEVSSHALQQGRVDGVRFDAVLFTNLSRDHIDYHGDMRAYGEAKAKLIVGTDARHRIINIDTEFGQTLAQRCKNDAVIVSLAAARAAAQDPYVFVRSLSAKRDGSIVAVETSWGDAEFMLPLVGRFNVANAIAVLALLLCWDMPLTEAADLLEAVHAPPGRMQKVEFDAETPLPSVFVDYAHTPDALEAALTALKPHCSGELWCVFGCGGDRDQGKRHDMGVAVDRLADRAVVTNDNPRHEDPEKIIQQVLAAMRQGAQAIEDRAAAIAFACANAQPDDVVLLAGKGHETTQQFGAEFLPFSDYATASANLAKRAGAAL